jgi:hypothetical protein
MPAKIPEVTRFGVIDSWLSGHSRRVTAIKYGISEGAVSSIVKEFTNQHGPQRAELLRALAITLSKTGTTAEQCAQGHRIIMIMKRMGAEEDDHERFLTDISKKYVQAGHDPVHIFKQLDELHSFLDRNRGRHELTSIPQIEEIIEKKKQEMGKLNEEIPTLNSQKKDLEGIIHDLQLKKLEIESELRWDSELLQALKTKGLQFESVPRFVSAAILLKERGYDVFEISEEFSKFEEIFKVCADIELRVNMAQLKLEGLDTKNRDLELQLAMNSQSVKVLSYLNDIGFGLPEFKQLRYLLAEVATQEGLTPNAAVKKVFDDLQDHYYDYIWLRNRVAELKSERDRLSGVDMSSLKQIFPDFFNSTSKMPMSTKTEAKARNTPGYEVRETKTVLSALAPASSPQQDTKSAHVDPPSQPNLIPQNFKSLDLELGKDWRDIGDLPTLVKESITNPLMRQMKDMS